MHFLLALSVPRGSDDKNSGMQDWAGDGLMKENTHTLHGGTQRGARLDPTLGSWPRLYILLAGRSYYSVQ